MKEYDTISDLKKAIDRKEIEDDLQIVLDNDEVYFLINDGTDEIKVKSASGYSDIEELYKLVFPKANVDWC